MFKTLVSSKCMAPQDSKICPPLPSMGIMAHSCLQAVLCESNKQHLYKARPLLYKQLQEREALGRLFQDLNAQKPEAKNPFDKSLMVGLHTSISM